MDTTTLPGTPSASVRPAADTTAAAAEGQAPPTFDALPLSAELRRALDDMGYVHPTPVQLAIWEPATRGKDCVVQARTGTGKTAAFGLPIIDHLVKRGDASVQVLTLCPTRELALQVSREIERLAKHKDVKITAIYGGAPIERQIDAIAAGAQFVAGTPGRVLDHLRRGTLDAKNIRLLVLDECDEMLSMGFERELNAILEFIPKERQTLLFSATVPPDIERIAKQKLKNPEFVTLSGDHIGALSIQHFVYLVPGDKLTTLTKVIEVENPESALVFCNTKEQTEVVAGALQRQGYDADWLNGDLPQSDRERVMAATREGRLRFLVATDVAARGIDLSHLTHVINCDFPQDAETYVHRTGRTGRAGRTGTAISLVTPRDIGGLYLLRLTYKIRPIERQIPSAGELKTRAEADLITMLVEAFATKEPHPDDLALTRRLLTHDQAERVIAGLLRDHLGARPTAQEEASASRRARMVAAPAAERPAREGEAARPASEERGGGRREGRGGRDRDRDRDRGRDRGDRGVRAEREPQGERAPRVEAAVEPGREPAQPAREAAPRDDRERRPRDDRDRRPRDDRDRRPRGEGRRGEDRPVTGTAATGAATATPTQDETARARGASRPFARHADFVTWQPPEEEGDDEPILAKAAAARGGEPGAAEAPREPRERRERQPREPREPRERREPREPRPAVEAGAAPSGEGEPLPAGELGELFVNVGRRDGVRAADLQNLLAERAGIERESVRRVRVRDRHSFVSVRKTDVEKAIAGLSGAVLGGRTVNAEVARERPREAPEPEAAEDAASTSETSE
jgi:ATP-dependent RNA helicase DeaD